ncbi:hypothetical protein Pcinc_012145 [Petrolisthes cinctipes]|uniref:Reelin domain-containing protein n=1 Tax=Petrolisthes cinctipes TaxID=88211 RepID=A0AAE1G1B6_PETCI|nr:hypothetical protein Pcinc_012145 [Petrolisthes cinctipes]
MVLEGVIANPDMVPDSACGWLSPWHEPYTSPSEDPVPYKLRIYQQEVLAGSVVQVCIVGQKMPLKGFMMQGQSVDDGEVVGSWVVQYNSSLSQTKACQQTDDTVTHTNSDDKQLVPLYWQAPTNYQGMVIFKTAVVANYSTYWTDITSPTFKVSLNQ